MSLTLFAANAPALENTLTDNFNLERDVLPRVVAFVSPVWPLQDYVAVNPYFGLADQSFERVRETLRQLSNCELLMPVDYYADQYQQGRFEDADVTAAIEELGAEASLAEEILAQLNVAYAAWPVTEHVGVPENAGRRMFTFAELASTGQGIDWSEVARDEISRYCSAHYDQGQAVWASPTKQLGLYAAWREGAERDRNLQSLGIRGACDFVSTLPESPMVALEQLLERMSVPRTMWAEFLIGQALSIPGWSAWARYQDAADGARGGDFVGLLAIRVAYDALFKEARKCSADWGVFADGSQGLSDETQLLSVLLRASEIGYRRKLLSSMDRAAGNDSGTERKLAQMVFCIDVRSERIRRRLESACSGVETFGFAGFFGMPIEFVPIGEANGVAQLPVLLKPQFKLHEGLDLEHDRWTNEAKVIERRLEKRSWRKLCKDFQTSAIGCFSFVETTGLFFGWTLLQKTIRWAIGGERFEQDGVLKKHRDLLRPTLCSLNGQGVDAAKQVDLAESMLRGIGLIGDFAKLVVLCGHGSQSENNPLAAGLDCGACGGHSGQPNARFAATLLNEPEVRGALAERGIKIPTDTYFVPALHNTTTDAIEFFDVETASDVQAIWLRELSVVVSDASEQTRAERMPVVASNTMSDLMRRAVDWSEVRPEWGLAGNAAFIVAPRSFTKHVNLDARAFLHSYDYRRDPEGQVLEVIMTAPMIVANWINMQYYASTVDNAHFGSGNKMVHNVVGHFGILSGNGGDLRTGLPWQSLHTGEQLQHLPLRLQVVIAAPRESVERIITKHALVADLLRGQWLHLVVMDDQGTARYSTSGEWESVEHCCDALALS